MTIHKSSQRHSSLSTYNDRDVYHSQRNPPLQYEAMLDSPPLAADLAKIHLLRSHTRTLVQQLWDAARDIEAVETLALPIKQYPPDLVREELAGLSLDMGTAASLPSKSAYSSPTRLRPQSRLSAGRARSRQLHARTDSIPPITSGHTGPFRTDPTLNYISSTPPTALNIERMRKFSTVSRPISSSRSHSPVRSASPSRRNPLSAEKVRIPPLSREVHQAMLKQRRTDQANEILLRDDAYFADLSKYRSLYPDMYTCELPKRAPKIKTSIHRQPVSEVPLKMKQDDGYHYVGVFRINDRLFPEPLDHPYLSVDDALEGSLGERSRQLASCDPPVKVSIPSSRIQPTQRHYKHHRRASFDPADSVDISAYLHKGYRPYLWSSQMLRISSEHASLKEELLYSRC
ncbi:hypothetical protein BASA50_000591 [Batrachochytrium salamandrivorans]|uniref:Uncharacterized protein n=1 Tax=Batrachochytrium salamandrivorans TaxID=1357716 RepID=A0ABQ8EVJ8_9FUNG|nr:hypothetical protein BASA50_000591 [Batrachochytrium salamandrivorans]KAJ1328342.1 hypothetical protein BSLG_010074 [Batrachochytrium salamandrivorans]